MITRRQLMLGSAALLLDGPERAHGDNVLAVGNSHAGSVESLIALPGKSPLIKRTTRPPNFETPLLNLRPPFTSNESFFVRYHVAVIPEVDPATWRVRVGGTNAKRALALSLEDLKSGFERVSIAAINQCSGNRRGLFSPRVPGVQWGYGAMGNAIWSGVRLRDVLRKVGVGPGALEVVFDGTDSALLQTTPDFVKSLPIDRALDENTMIAFEMNGQPLPHWNGAPARLVVPGWTATYWVKHLTEIRVEPKAFDGFWMKSGYRIPVNAFPGARFTSQDTLDTTPITEILVNSLVTSHTTGSRLERGRPAQLSGWAWDNGAGIARVEISTDGRRTWREAALDEDLGRFAWRGFRWSIDVPRVGSIEFAIRAHSRNGGRQPDQLTANPAGYHHNVVQTLVLEVV